MFKNFIIVAALAVSMAFLAVPAMAADVQFSGLNVSGDTLYLPSSGSFAVGIGTDLARVNDFVDIRGVLVTEVTKDQDNKAGLGVGINLPRLINKIGGSWIADNVNASVGVTALVNLDGNAHIEPAVYISLVNWKY